MDYSILVLFILLKVGATFGKDEGQVTETKKKGNTDDISNLGSAKVEKSGLQNENKTKFEAILEETLQKREGKKGKSFLTPENVRVGVPLEVAANNSSKDDFQPPVTKVINRDQDGKPPIIIYEGGKNVDVKQQNSDITSHGNNGGFPSAANFPFFGRRLPVLEDTGNQAFRPNINNNNKNIYQMTFPEVNSFISRGGRVSLDGRFPFSLGRPEDSFRRTNNNDNTDATSLFLSLYDDDIDDLLDDDYFERVVREDIPPGRPAGGSLLTANVANSNGNVAPRTGVPLPALNSQTVLNTADKATNPGVNFHLPNGGIPVSTSTHFRIKPNFDNSREDSLDDSPELPRPLDTPIGDLNSKDGKRLYDSSLRRYHLHQQHLIERKRKFEPNYSFGYEVHNLKATHSHQEQKKGNRVEGTYHTDLPNGLRQIVRYYADETGYHPTITYEPIQSFYTQKIVSGPPSSYKIDNQKAIIFPSYERFANTKNKNFGMYTSSSSSSPSVSSSSNSPDDDSTNRENKKSSSTDDPMTDQSDTGIEMELHKPPRPLIDPKHIRKSSKPHGTNPTVEITEEKEV